MPVVAKLDVVMADREVRSKDLAAVVGITEANMSLLKQGKVMGIRFDMLESICQHLHCQPGDILHLSKTSLT